MKLIIIRHGDPDYSIDSLTEKGWREAELLSERISRLDVKAFYCSPLGRAKDTASLTLKKMNRKAKTLNWLREFEGRVSINGEMKRAWDRLPREWTDNDDYYCPDKWLKTDLMQSGTVEKEYKNFAGVLINCSKDTVMFTRAEYSKP